MDKDFRKGIRAIITNPELFSSLDSNTINSLYKIIKKHKVPTWKCSASLGFGAEVYFASDEPDEAYVGLCQQIIKDLVLRQNESLEVARRLKFKWSRWDGDNYKSSDAPKSFEKSEEDDFMLEKVGKEAKDTMKYLLAWMLSTGEDIRDDVLQSFQSFIEDVVEPTIDENL